MAWNSWIETGFPSRMAPLKLAAGLSFRKLLTALARETISSALVATAVAPLKCELRTSKGVSFTARRRRVFLDTR